MGQFLNRSFHWVQDGAGDLGIHKLGFRNVQDSFWGIGSWEKMFHSFVSDGDPDPFASIKQHFGRLLM